MLNVQKVRLEKKKKVSKYRLCKETGISFNSLTSLENGGDVRLSTLERIAKVLKVEVKDLFE